MNKLIKYILVAWSYVIGGLFVSHYFGSWLFQYDKTTLAIEKAFGDIFIFILLTSATVILANSFYDNVGE